MSNALFDPGREGILDDTIEMSVDDIRVILIRSTYSFDITDKFIVDLGSVDNGRSVALTGKTFTNGIFNAVNTSIVATAAVPVSAIVVVKHTGSDATARVICYDDTVVSGLPFTPAAGQTLNILWDTGANKVFKL
jgi:hypothetical protein